MRPSFFVALVLALGLLPSLAGAQTPGQVRSSLARRLSMDAGVPAPMDRNVEGVVEMMLDAA